MPERSVPPPDVLQPPAACPRCASRERLFTPNAAREPYASPPLYEPAWQCVRCGALEFISPPESTGSGRTPGPEMRPDPISPLAGFLQPVQVDDEGRLWLSPDCEDWGPIVRQHHLTAVFDLEEGLDRGIPAHPDRVIYVYFPINDDDLPTLHKLHAVARLGAELMRNGERVLVHCEMGLNRSGLLAGLMMVYTGMTGPAAIARLQERRPGALYNRRFAAHLETQPAGGNEEW